MKEIKARAQKVGLPFRTWATLASTPESRVHESNLSNWLGGYVTSESKVKRLVAILALVEDLVASTSIRPALNDAENVKAALKRLAEIRANPAQDTRRYGGAVATPEDNAGATSSASGILAGVE